MQRQCWRPTGKMRQSILFTVQCSLDAVEALKVSRTDSLPSSKLLIFWYLLIRSLLLLPGNL